MNIVKKYLVENLNLYKMCNIICKVHNTTVVESFKFIIMVYEFFVKSY